MASSNVRTNPYNVGPPNEELFFAREVLFGVIENHLRQNVKVIMLYGQRRIGKSSVLKQIPKFFAQKEEFKQFIFINFDFQDKASFPLSQVLHVLAQEILDHLSEIQIKNDDFTLPTTKDLEANPDIFSQFFLLQIYQKLGNTNLVLLLDEFAISDNNHNTTSVYKHFFIFLKKLIKQHEQLFLIPVVGTYRDDVLKLQSFFEHAAHQEIGLLDELSAQHLITKPAQGALEYDQDAIKAILELSARHPYLIQTICFVLFRRAQQLLNTKITCADVDAVVDTAIDYAEAGLAWFWDELSIPERVIFAAVAEAQKIAFSNNQQIPENPLRLLERCGILQTEQLSEAREQLVRKGFLDDTELRLKVELVRRWLLKRHPLGQEIWELKNLGN